MGINFQPIYILASGAERAKDRLDKTANNLANVNTPGFKKIILREMTQNIPNNPGDSKEIFHFARFNDTPVILEQGSLKKTDRSLDFAIQGDGFFVVQDSSGNQFLTRNGHFFLDKDGYLVDRQGNTVLDKSGNPVVLNPDIDIAVTEEGIITQNNKPIAEFQIISYSSVSPVGNSYYKPNVTQTQPSFKVFQGFLENSNVSGIREMIELIEANRRFDIYGNLMKALDQLEQKSHEIGRA